MFKLRLRVRIYIRNVCRITDASTLEQLGITLKMDNKRVERFVLVFTSPYSLGTWKILSKASQLSRASQGCLVSRWLSRRMRLSKPTYDE
jgi:hypothetical protein